MANLSNINNKLIVTDGGNLLVNATANLATYGGITIDNFSDPSIAMKTTSTSGWLWTQYITNTGTTNFSMGVNQTIPYWCVKAGAGMDSPHLVVNSSGNVGIGTTSPDYNLEIEATDAKAFVHYVSASRGGIAAYSSQRIAFTTTASADDLVFGYNSGTNATSANFVEHMRIDNGTGNVGIGADSPGTKLEVRQVDDTFDDLDLLTLKRVWSTASGSDRAHGIVFNDVNSKMATIYADRTNSGSNYNSQLLFSVNSGSLPTSMITPMVINNLGRVGIGTTSPDTKLELYGNTSSGGFGAYPALTIKNDNASGFSAVHFNQSTTQKARIEVSNSVGSMGLYTTSGTNGILINSSGNVGIGVTGPVAPLDVFGAAVQNGSTPGIKLSSSNTQQTVFAIGNTGTRQYELAVGGTTSSVPGAFYIYDNNASDFRITLATSGNVGIAETAPAEKLEVNGNIKAKDVDGKFYSTVASWVSVASKNDLFSYPGNGGALWEYVIKMNPNSAGSGVYSDNYYGKLGIGIGWNGSAVTQYIWQQQDQTAPRSLYPSGGGNFNPLFRMYYSGGIYTELAYGTAWTLRIQGLSTSTFGDIYFRRLA